MSSRIYARLKLESADLELIRRMLSRGAETCGSNAASASGADERAFYEGTERIFADMLVRFEVASPGIVAFSEDDLKLVRGAIFPVLFPELMARHQTRASLTEDEARFLSEEIDHLTDLQRRLDQPLIDDRSHDPEPEEEDTEDEDDFPLGPR